MFVINTDKTRDKKHIEFPHILVLITCIILLASLLTYVVPAGIFEKDEVTGALNPDSFHFIENTPVSPIDALLSVQKGIVSSGTVISLLLILGGATAVLLSVGAIESLIELAIYKYKDKSVKVVIPIIYVLMSILGALAGNDSMMAFVAVGVVISKRLKLDRLAATAMFYLPYIMGQAAGPTTVIILTAQNMLGLEPLSGLGVRLILWTVFTTVGCIYTTRYAIRVQNNPSKSFLSVEDCFCEDIIESDLDNKSAKFELKAFISVFMLFISYGIYAYGAKAYGWSWPHLTSCVMLMSICIGMLYRLSPNKFATIFLNGAKDMGGVCLILGFAKVVGSTLADGNIIHTIAYVVTSMFEGLGSGICALGLFIFNLLFNFLVPSGTSQAAIVLPVITPIGDIVGVSRQVMSLVLQLGDGLTNCLTPLSGVMVGCITLGKVTYAKWFRYAAPVVLLNIVIGGAFVFVLQILGWS